MRYLEATIGKARSLGPYLLLELLLPGGSLWALALYLYRRRVPAAR